MEPGPHEPRTRPVARVRKNEVAVIVEVDAGTTQLLGWEPGDMVGLTSLEFIHHDDHQLAVENWMQMLATHGPGRTIRLRHKHKDGSWVWVALTNHNYLDDPADSCVWAEMVDVGDQMGPPSVADGRPVAQVETTGDAARQPVRLHEALRAREQLLHRLAEALPLGVLQVDAGGRIVYTNHRLHVILGKARAASVEEQLSVVVAADKARVAEAFEAVLRGGLDGDVDVEVAPGDGLGTKELRQCTMSLRALTAEDGTVTGAIACVADVTDSVRIREELRRRATFDDVTACHNRAATMEALDQALACAAPHRVPAVIFVDLDGFKEVNDRHGHAAGDELLAIVARRLGRAVRAEDLVGRIGGDEFLVVCPGISSPEEARQAAARVAATFRHDVRLKAAIVSVRASIGVAWSTSVVHDADALVTMADTAMYDAKRAGDGVPVLFPVTPC